MLKNIIYWLLFVFTLFFFVLIIFYTIGEILARHHIAFLC